MFSRLLLLTLLIPVLLRAQNEIIIDGQFDDWDAVTVSVSDPANDEHDTEQRKNGIPAPDSVNYSDVDILETKFTHDQENLYGYVKASGVVGRTSKEADGHKKGRYYFILTIDVDNNNTTGYDLEEGGYWPNSSGYDMNMEVEYYNGEYNTGHYLHHGFLTDAEYEQGRLDLQDYTVKLRPGNYDLYTQWVVFEDSSYVEVSDKGPVYQGIIEVAVSEDGHEAEMKAPMWGFFWDEFGYPIVKLGDTIDISFSLEGSGELSESAVDAGYNGTKSVWGSDTAEPIVGYLLEDFWPEPQVVAFNDTILERVVRTRLNKPDGEILSTDMETLVSISTQFDSIKDLTGLEYAKNLTFLKIYSGHVSDISVVANMPKLEVINFFNNQITDISPMRHLSQLEYVNLSFNQIEDISPLQNSVNITDLFIKQNQISDITPLQYMHNLERLYSGENLINDISSLENLINLELLEIEENQINDISVVENMTNLKTLRAHRNEISDISPLQPLANMEVLLLSDNPVGDIDALQSMTNIRILYLTNTQISDITTLQNATNMEQLYISSNSITDISILQNMPNLNALAAYTNNIKNIGVLENLTNLNKLYLDGNGIHEISALSDLTNLTRLHLSTNLIDNRDLEQLYALDSLKYLELQYNPGIISGAAVQTLADNLDKMECTDINWRGTCGYDPNKAAISWFTPDSADVGEEITVQATATDSGQAQVQVKIDWGDGNVSEYSDIKENGDTFEFTHSYSTDGIYNIVVMARNEFGSETNWSNHETVVVGDPTSSVDRVNNFALDFSLEQNYPNPFNPKTTIEYKLVKSGQIKLTVLDILGREVAVLVDENQPTGNYKVTWTAQDFPSGIYVYSLSTGSETKNRKMLVIK
jgi:Leucine-rich repeat (LRR) protein